MIRDKYKPYPCCKTQRNQTHVLNPAGNTPFYPIIELFLWDYTPLQRYLHSDSLYSHTHMQNTNTDRYSGNVFHGHTHTEAWE